MTGRNRIFLFLVLLIQISIIWPVYPAMSDIYPLVFGLPFSFFWVVLMLVASFLTLLWYFLTETADQVDSDNPVKQPNS